MSMILSLSLKSSRGQTCTGSSVDRTFNACQNDRKGSSNTVKEQAHLQWQVCSCFVAQFGHWGLGLIAMKKL